MLVDMGLGDETAAKMALTAAFGNVDVAANYLMSPDLMANIQQNANQSEFNIPMNPLGGVSGGEMPPGMPFGMEGMTEEQLVQMMQQQPEMFAPLIEEIARQDPALLEQIRQNPQQFLGLLLQGMQNGEFAMNGEEELLEDDEMEMDTEDIEGEEGADDDGDQAQLTEEQSEAIGRLQAMFPHIPQMMILQTYQACGQDEALAANLLMDSPGF